MKIDVRQSFACTPTQFWELWWDPEWEAAEAETSPVRPEILDERTEGGLRLRHQRFTSTKPIPGAMKKAIGSETLTYDQHSRIDDAAHSIAWEVVPPVAHERVRASGTVTVQPSAGGCTLHLQGEVKVGIPLIGGKIEQAIVGAIVQGYEASAPRRREWIAARYA